MGQKYKEGLDQLLEIASTNFSKIIEYIDKGEFVFDPPVRDGLTSLIQDLNRYRELGDGDVLQLSERIALTAAKLTNSI